MEIKPRPDNIPQRPRMTANVLRNLYAGDVIHGNPTTAARSAQKWLGNMRTWAAWAIEYRKRLDAVYVEHQAIAHDNRVEPGRLSDSVDLRCGFGDHCKVCAYLYEQHAANQLEECS